MFNLNKLKIEPLSTGDVINSSSPQSTNLQYTPIQVQTAYGLNLISVSSGKPLGYGIKIAVITVYHYSNLQSDLNIYCKKYGLIPITLNIINQAGNISNTNWALESNLDVQMINTVAPGATVYVIEAKSTAFNDIKTALQTSVNLGVNIISMSFGSSEFSTQSSLEYLFLNTGIMFIASSGDNNIPNYPATSGNVLALGGTILTLNQNNTRQSEIIWDLSGSGVSKYTPTPSYQNVVNNSNKRNIPDLCLLGSSNSSFIIYSSINGGYINIGGTSVSTPLMAGIVAIANQLRKINNKAMLNSISSSSLCIQKYLYKTILPTQNLYSQCLYDITSGTSNQYITSSGYDIASGLGSINANFLCPQLVNL